ncbi:DUF6035 family protein [Flavobacterium muglaense]|uniref:Competence protein n=1 Tax=Flavobacterium muglaense TaxID=2764716 RepID=A0A923SLE9_9FLAO|nr:DUF6035 family protein [Flavobacterium muglaense]MBC5839674.1 hypothetical protein [Flavobacterium muglaense]MBC5846193.1 hypothetical protein [Flavobacterium muglaense]
MEKVTENIRTIETVLNLDTGQIIYANTFLELGDHIVFPYREKCQDAYKKKRDPFLVCDTCGQMIQISGGKGINGKIKYFKHLKDSNDCPIKTDTKLSREDILRGKFNGQQEGALHIETKNLIYDFLFLNKETKGEISFAQKEMVNKSERNYLEWKKPDITSVFKEKKLVFENQLATTFLDVICERQHFYKDNKTFIIWVFKNFEIEADKQRFTQKDIFYSNNRNAFILDQEAINLSRINNDLFLLCQYQKPIANIENIEFEWESKYINLSELTFDINSYKVYYFDVDKAENEVKLEIDKKISERTEEERLLNEEGKKIRLQEIEKRKEAQRLIEIEQEELRLQEIEREKQHEKNKAGRQKAIDDEQLDYENKNALFFERLKLNYSSLSPLQIIFNSGINEIHTKTDELFRNGYNPTKGDLSFLKIEYQIELSNYKTSFRNSILYFLSLAIIHTKLKSNPDYLKHLPRIERVLIAVLSIKEKKVIGYSFKNLVEIPNHFYNPRGKIEFAQIILEAIKTYYGLDDFLRIEDKKGILKRKLEKYNIANPIKEISYNQIISSVFKDLKFENNIS